MPTSISGCTFPVAVTRWVIVRMTAFSVVTVVGTAECLLLKMAAPINTASSTTPRTIHHIRRDFLRTGAAVGAAAVPGAGDMNEFMVRKLNGAGCLAEPGVQCKHGRGPSSVPQDTIDHALVAAFLDERTGERTDGPIPEGGNRR